MSLAVEHPLVRAACAEACGATDETPRPDFAEELYALKQKVPACIDAIGAKRWRMRVDALSLLHRRPPPHAINRAYAKMSEIMLTSALRCPRSSLHLGEAPGGFVQCIGDAARAGAWNWTAVSLPSGPQFQLEKLPVHCGRVVYADLLDGDAAALADPDARFDLVTADGACEMDHERLEEEHLPLLVAQARIACARCEVGGNVVIKFYEGCHPATLAVLASLTQCFEPSPCSTQQLAARQLGAVRRRTRPPARPDVPARMQTGGRVGGRHQPRRRRTPARPNRSAHKNF